MEVMKVMEKMKVMEMMEAMELVNLKCPNCCSLWEHCWRPSLSTTESGTAALIRDVRVVNKSAQIGPKWDQLHYISDRPK